MNRALATVLLALLAVPGDALAQRERISMDPGWRFTLGDPAGAEAPGFDDGAWRRLDLPHDWSIEGTPEEGNPGGGQIGYFPTGIGWYRRSFDLPASAAGKRVWIQFDGIHMNSDIWINGHHLGRRPFGYVSIHHDITPHLRPGRNVLAVRVDNSRHPNSRYYTGSGIYRHSWMTITDPLHVGHWGTYVTTPTADSAAATIALRTRVENDHATARRGTLRSLAVDPAGWEVGSVDAPFSLQPGEQAELTQQIPVTRPALWSPDQPALYSLRQVVLDGSRPADTVAVAFGIRSIAFDKDLGFLLNGERMKLNGVNLHHDAGAFGAAVPERVWERRFEILKEMGVNAIRTAHNPFAPEFLDLTDRMGFLVMNEAFDEWTVGKVTEGYNRYFAEWSRRDLEDFVRRDRNHPSIVLWSAGNEIGEQRRPDGHEVLARLQDIIHREDPSRPVTTGNDQIAADNGSATEAFLNTLDIVGYNYVDRWHERRELYAEQDRHRHPEWKMIGTESGSARDAPGGVYSLGDDPARVQPNYTTGMIRAEELWKWILTHDYYAGDFMWTGIDYLGETRWPGVGAGAGPIDIIGLPKAAYYFYRSQWTDEPVLHLFPHWNWPGREGQLIPVLAYSSCTVVELFLNGRSLGEKRMEFPMQGTSGGWNSYERPQVRPTTTDLHLTWDVPYEPGVLRAVGTRHEGEPCEAEVRTAGAPAALRLSVDRPVITTAPGDLAHVVFEVVDAQGVVVPTADNRVTITVEGGTLLVMDNGDLRDHDPYRSNSRRAFKGRGMAVVRGDTPGTMTVRAEAEGLGSAAAEIEVEIDN